MSGSAIQGEIWQRGMLDIQLDVLNYLEASDPFSELPCVTSTAT
jgi:hypothetical protein